MQQASNKAWLPTELRSHHPRSVNMCDYVKVTSLSNLGVPIVFSDDSPSTDGAYTDMKRLSSPSYDIRTLYSNIRRTLQCSFNRAFLGIR